MLQDPSPRRRWPRSQQFTLTDKGREAEASYRSSIVSSRTQEGRASFDAARSTWAKSFRLLPDDGLYLGELADGPINLGKIVEALQACDKTRQDALTALERLFDAGLISTASQASPRI
jgi:hypothetical protein